jgi:hypothetical protein
MSSRSGACLALLLVLGVGACVSLDKPKAVATCAGLHNCSNNGVGGAAGLGGAAGSATGEGGSAGGTTGNATGGSTGPSGTGGDRGTGGAATPDAAADHGSGGSAVDASTDVALGGAGGHSGTGGAKTGGTTGTGGSTPGTGGAPGTGGKSGTGGAPGTGGTVGPDAGPDASPLSVGLVAYYNFDSVSGTDVPDLSGKNNTGKLTGGTTGYELVTGKIGKALSLHKAGPGYVSVPVAAFANTTDLTIAAWVNVTTAQSWQRLLDVGIDAKAAQNSQTGTKYMNIVPKNSGTNIGFYITNNGIGSEQSVTGASPNAGTWAHVAVVLSSSGGTLFIDGAQVTTSASLTLRAKDLGSIDYAYIGKSQFTSDPAFDGIVDELRVYNRALSAKEVQDLKSLTTP